MSVRKGTEGEFMASSEPAASSTTDATSAPSHSSAVIGIATYNERENLPTLLDEIRRTVPQVDILVTDDNSPDGTGALADELARNDPRIHVVHRAGKLGLGTAILDGMRYAMQHDYDLLLNMDADFSHHPRYLPTILAGMQKYDVMVGSRYVPGGGTAGWPLTRRLMSWGVGSVVRLLLRIPARDTSGAYRCYRVSKLREIDLNAVVSRGYSFQQEMLWRCHTVGCKIGETPIFFENRRAGKSKVNPHEAVRSMGVILWLGIGAFFGFNRSGKANA
jgi:dolichol-phosphate mannosyltransferase